MDEVPPTSDPVQEGIRLFNQGYFFEAHELLEEVWHREHGEARLFLQGLIQAAAGFHHLKNGNLRGAIALFRKSLDKLRHYPHEYHEIDLGDFIGQVESARGALEALPNAAGPPPLPPPKIVPRASGRP